MFKNSKVTLTRAMIYTKDIEKFTGLSKPTARKMLRNVRTALGKTKEDILTIREFCIFYHIDETLLKEYITD